MTSSCIRKPLQATEALAQSLLDGTALSGLTLEMNSIATDGVLLDVKPQVSNDFFVFLYPLPTFFLYLYIYICARMCG